MELKNIALVGAGGNIGNALVPLLLSTPDRFTVTALTRGTYTPPSPLITVHTVDYTSLSSLTTALRGQDAVLSLVPGGQAKWASQKLLIDASIAAGVRLFVASEYVADIMAPHYAFFPTEMVGDKVRIRGYLEECAGRGEICWSALNGGPFFDMWLLRGPSGFDIPRRHATIYGTGANPTCWTPLPTIARAVVHMLLHPTAIANRAIYVCGVTGVTQNALLAALEAELGAFTIERVDVAALKAEALGLLAQGGGEARRRAMRGLTLGSQFDEEGSAANFGHLVENAVVGVEPVGVREAVREALVAAGLK